MPNRLPRIGVIGIMQELYDEMLPGITERQGRYLGDIARALEDVMEPVVAAPARNRADIEQVTREFEYQGVDGVLIVMLTYGPGQRVVRALGQTRLPLCLANVQPEGQVTAEWDMADMTYNQGIHGAQDTANALVRAGAVFDVVTEEWRSDAFRDRIGRWARAAHAVTAWRGMKVAQVGYGMDDMGDTRFDEGALLRTLGPAVTVDRPRRAAPRDGRRRRRRGGRGDRLRGRAVRDRPAALAAGARGPRAHAGRARGAARGARVRAPSPPTSTRSARTGASRASRSLPPRA